MVPDRVKIIFDEIAWVLPGLASFANIIWVLNVKFLLSFAFQAKRTLEDIQ